MKNLIQFLFLSFSITIFGQTDSDAKFINDIINEITEKDSTLLEPGLQITDSFNSGMQGSPEYFIHESVFKRLSPYFNIVDSLYYFNQIEKYKNVQLDLREKKSNYKFVSKQNINDYIAKNEEDYNKGIRYDFYAEFDKQVGYFQEFALPLISKDNKYLYFRFINIKGRKLRRVCEKIYERKGDEWVYIKTIMDSVE